MVRIALAAAALALAGCASYSDMQAKPPLLEFTTDQTADAYAGCVMPKARDIWRGMVSIAPDGDGLVIVVQSDIGVVSTATLSPAADGTRVIYRARGTSAGGAWPDALRACR